jgi:A/G-specific adenine glycosylase
MWELPRGELHDGEPTTAGAVRVAAEVVGVAVEAGAVLAVVRHAVTRFRITLSAVEVKSRARNFNGSYTAWAWVDATTAAEYPMSTPQREVVGRVVG